LDEFARAVENAIGDDATELAAAKINLALHVTGRRTDGYHMIESLVAFADYGDIMGAAPAGDGRMRLSVKGEFAELLTRGTQPTDNLALRAADALAMAAGKGRPPATWLSLVKRIPVAAGLGGGSSDAAAALRLLNREWRLGLADADLAKVALGLGADVPMCLISRPLIARGIGEAITPIAGLPALPVVLAHPGVPVLTAAVFGKLEAGERTPLPPLPAKFSSLLDVIFWLRQARNDLSEPAEAVNKAAAAATKALMRDPDCLFARMSGSGAAAFGIFATLKAAEKAAERLRAAKPDWWVVAAKTLAS
jgi:4-diphosphocytidyl-2-C-methyl-D-erythritol kinase